ncbi:hypothetical protein D4S03_03270 [bacterium]|nr:MAG: hypothetical protein D4S03_03270 [bacterium]
MTPKLFGSLSSQGDTKTKTAKILLNTFIITLLVATGLFAFSNSEASGVATITSATGATSVSLDTTSASGGTSAWTTLVGPVIQETLVGQIKLGIHTLTLPAGWEFNPVHNVTIGVGGATELTIGVSVVTPTATTLSFYVNGLSTSGVGSLTFNEMQVRPTGTTPTSDNITLTAGLIDGVDGSTNFGTLTTVAGAVNKVEFTTQPSATATAGVAFATQPVVTGQDQFGNTRLPDTSTITLSAYTDNVCTVAAVGTFTGTLTKAEVSGVADFAVNGVNYQKAETIYLKGSDGVRTKCSSAVVVSPNLAETLTFDQVPVGGNQATAILSTQPRIHVVDAYGNHVADATPVTASLATGAGTLRTTLTANTASGIATFTDLAYNKLDSFSITFTANVNKTVTSGALTVTAGPATQVRVETVAGGSGIVAPSQSLISGNTLHVYSVSRDTYDNFVANAVADSWSFSSKTVGVADGNLVADGDKKGAVMTGALVGTGVIHAAISGLASIDSGTVTVTVGPAATLAVAGGHAPATTDTVDNIFTTQPWILVRDAAGNPVSGETVTVSLAVGGGALRTTLTAVSGVDGLAKFTDLGYSKTDAFQLHFADGAVVVDAVAFGPLTAGAATILTFTTPPAGGNAATANLTTQPVVHVVDQYGNIVVNGTVVTASKASGSGTLRTTLTATTASGDATFTDLAYNKLDTFSIIFTANGHTVTSGDLTVIHGAATKINVETLADGSGSIKGDTSLTSGANFTVYGVTRDVYDNYAGNPADTVWSFSSKTGVVDGDLTGSPGASAVMHGNLVGTAVIHAEEGGLTVGNSGTITVIHGALASITVAPDVLTITADQTQVYTSTGNDAQGNTWDVTSDTTFTIVGAPAGSGSFTGATYTPQTAGIYQVRGVDGIRTDDTTSLTVTHGAATKYVILNPTDGTVDAAITVTVQLQDQFDNVVTTGANKDDDVTLNANGSATGGGVVNISNGVGTRDISDQVAQTVNLTLSNPVLVGANVTSTQDVIFAHGVATKIKVETLVNGSGSVVASQSLTSGNVLHVYSISRDQYDNFVENAVADSWSFSSRTGGVAIGDLVADVDSKGAVMTGALVGTGVIHAVKGALVSTDSGTITVTVGPVDHLHINVQPASTLSVDSVFDTHAIVEVHDIANNPVSGVDVVADRDPSTGSGTLRGTLTVATNGSGQATFSNLGYNKVDAFKVRFTSNTKTIISSQVGPLVPGTATTVAINTQPAGTNSVDAALTTQPAVHVTDQYGNNVADGVTVTAT